MTRVGVVILTHNRRDELLATLSRMVALRDRPQLVVVDNAGPDDVARRVAHEFPDVDVVRLPANLGAAGRNAGVGRLNTPYVAFCDDDSWWAPGALDLAADILDTHPRLALVTGRVLVGERNAPDPACLAMDASPLPRVTGLPGLPVLGFMCAATMVRRTAFLEAGGFEPRFFLGGEEELLALDLASAGWALAYVREVLVHHHPSPRRNTTRRRRLEARNALWCAWLRRPWPSAVRRSVAILRERARSHATRSVVEALLGLPWVLRRRRVVPAELESALRTLERAYAVRRRAGRRPVAGRAGASSEEAPGSSSRLAR